MFWPSDAVAYAPQKEIGGELDKTQDFTWDIGKMKTDLDKKMDLGVTYLHVK